jgi:hypothetical protein
VLRPLVLTAPSLLKLVTLGSIPARSSFFILHFLTKQINISNYATAPVMLVVSVPPVLIAAVRAALALTPVARTRTGM